MKLQNAPCKNCPDRHVGCHSECPRYMDAKQAHAAAVQQKHEVIDFDAYLAERQKSKRKRRGQWK